MDKGWKREVKSKKIFTSVFMIALVLSLVTFIANQPAASADTIFLGKKGKNLDIELSPPEPLFHPTEDGFFYPGGPKIAKKLEVINIGDVPFRICRFNATFYENTNTHLADGLEIEILELGKGRGEKPNLLYNGRLSTLSEGVKVYGKRAVPPKDSVTLQISVWMPITAGNEYQGLTVTADISITVCFPPCS
jgi:hypothetical protein